tara:strand:+ start:93 stop:1070 length:978 start_codon:yes stop_codon:yes gene_type:complete
MTSISILTSTFNREYYLSDLYESLKKQTFKNFTWIIGNDGSTDNSDNLIKSFINEKKIKIIYAKSNLRVGKSTMDNFLYKLIKTDFFCYCGSDDYFDKNAFETMDILLKNIPENKKSSFHGIITQSINDNNESQTFYNDKIPKTNMFMTWEDVNGYIKGDATVLEKSSVYKGKNFKEVDFLISESTLMNEVHKNSYFLLSPIITKIMRRASDSISFGNKMRYNRGYAHSIAINTKENVFKKLKTRDKFFTVINYWRYAFHGDLKLNKSIKMWDITKKNYFFLFFWIFSAIYIVWDIMKNKVDKTHVEFNKNKKIAHIKIIKDYDD